MAACLARGGRRLRDKLSETTLYDDAASFIRPQLASVAGTAIPLPYGGKVRQVQADLNQQALRKYGISANDVGSALSIQNLITPVGNAARRWLKVASPKGFEPVSPPRKGQKEPL